MLVRAHQLAATWRNRSDAKARDTRPPGIYPIPATERCTHPQHEPPKHISIPHGHELVHVCPGCKRRLVIRSLQASWS